MRKLIILFIAVFAGSYLMAQTDADYIEIARDVLKVEKKAAIAEVMELSKEEANVFWPLYNEYDNKMHEIQNNRINVIMDYAAHFETLTDEKTDELWSKSMTIKQQLLKLEKSYYKKFKKILPVKKAALYFQAENKIASLINAEMALEIPFIDVK
jgi:vacuolar-type H+-ATPase catalytic subunit A/Vma1